MEINLHLLGKQEIESTTAQKKMRLSEHASSMVFQLFTKNVYSNPIGTVVREITSNCFDSHVEAGVNFPVIVRKGFEPESEMHYISFIDSGVGMSPDRVENIYGVYFESTKRVDNTQIGGFGIGGKTPLAYKRSTGTGDHEYDNSFYVITNYNGTRYYYMMYEGQDAPIISLLHEEPTTERNGTEVRVPILLSDLPNFAKECVRQLYYFENVIFEGFEEFESIKRYSDILVNEYQIVRAKNFLFRGNDYHDYAHVCLGKVAYPIDFSTLGLYSNDYQLPIALKLEIGDVNVTASRESLDYSKTTIAMLIKKLDMAKAEIKEMLVKQYENVVSLKQYFELKNDYGKLEFSNGRTIYVGNLIKQSEIDLSNFKYSFMKMPNDKQLFSLFFNVQSYGEPKNKRRWSSDNTSFEGSYKEIRTKRNVVYLEEGSEFQRKILKFAYLKSLTRNGVFHIVSPTNLAYTFRLSQICDMFNVHLDSVMIKNDDGTCERLNPFIESLIEMQNEYFDIVRENLENYDTLEVPEEFILSRKRGSMLTEDMKKKTIPASFNGGTRERVLLQDLFKTNATIFYGTQDDKHLLGRAYNYFSQLFNRKMLITGYNEYHNYFSHYDCSHGAKNQPKGGVMFIQIAVGNLKYMKYCKNAYHVSEFKHRMAYRKFDVIEKSAKIELFSDKYYSISDFYRDRNFVKLNETWGNVIIDIDNYMNSLPNDSKVDVYSNRSAISTYFDISSVKVDKVHNEILAKIEDIKFLERVNSDVLKYIYYDRYSRFSDNGLLKILKKVMVF
jgi:hypothetical protein